MKKIFAINGSASQNSSNERLLANFVKLTENFFDVTIFNFLKSLPNFDPQLSATNAPGQIMQFRSVIEEADGVIICTPEYIFSIPSGLKNALEWCVATTIFSEKPTGIITASADGNKGHEELQLIMKTLGAVFTQDTTLLIRGIKGKIDLAGKICDEKTRNELNRFISAYRQLLN